MPVLVELMAAFYNGGWLSLFHGPRERAHFSRARRSRARPRVADRARWRGGRNRLGAYERAGFTRERAGVATQAFAAAVDESAQDR